MWNDPIVEEVREIRNTHARKFKHDLKAIAADLKKQQLDGKHKIVSLPPKRPSILPEAKSEQKK
jgi:hypothetical protein